MNTLTKLHALLDSIDTSECLYEEQCAARNFAAHGRDLLRMVEAGQAMREMLSDGWNACRAWDAAAAEEEV
jgi:hypothetical protein